MTMNYAYTGTVHNLRVASTRRTLSNVGGSENEGTAEDSGMSGACSILDGHLYDELDLDEDLLDDEGMDDMFSVDLGDNMTAALDALVRILHHFLCQKPYDVTQIEQPIIIQAKF